MPAWNGWYSNPNLPEPVAATVQIIGDFLEITDNRGIARGHWQLDSLRHPNSAWTRDMWAICPASAPDARLILENEGDYNTLRGHAPQLRRLWPVWMRLTTGNSPGKVGLVVVLLGVIYAVAKCSDHL